jgi:hypothetical protein
MIIAALLVVAFVGATARGQKKHPEKNQKARGKVVKEIEREESAVAVEPGVVITMCMDSGRITVRGDERHEVRAQVPKGTKIDFGRAGDANANSPAARLEVMVAEDEGEDEEATHFDRCGGSADLELEVPRDATLFFKSEKTDFDIEGVAEVHIESNSGDIAMRRITRSVEATSIEGDVSLEDSKGRVRLESFGGSIEANNVSPTMEGDFFRAKSISNDISLEGVTHSRVEVSTISGEITVTGALARYARYEMRTTSGDITLTMPPDSSFRLTAKVSEGGEIVTDFPLKYTGGLSTDRMLSTGQMVGTYGKGEANINLASYSGTLRLRKQ